jgi:hypothetical protein
VTLGEPLDVVAATLAARSGLRFVAAATEAERSTAFRLRWVAVEEKGWAPGGATATGGAAERDRYDDQAVHLIGWRGDEPVCCGRLVLPPGPLPTEEACGIVVEPVGQVVDAGRMVVVPAERAHRRGVFAALLAALYLETRRQGFAAGCGMMAPNVRALARILGVELEVLGPDRPYWGELRAPVRFDASTHGTGVVERWS